MLSGSVVVVREDEREASIFSCKVRRLPFPIWALGSGAGRWQLSIPLVTFHAQCTLNALSMRRIDGRNRETWWDKQPRPGMPTPRRNHGLECRELTYLARPLERATRHFHHHDMPQLFLAGLVRGVRWSIKVWELLPSGSTGGFGRRLKCRRLHRAIWRSCAAVAHEPVKCTTFQIMHRPKLPFFA